MAKSLTEKDKSIYVHVKCLQPEYMDKDWILVLWPQDIAEPDIAKAVKKNLLIQDDNQNWWIKAIYLRPLSHGWHSVHASHYSGCGSITKVQADRIRIKTKEIKVA